MKKFLTTLCNKIKKHAETIAYPYTAYGVFQLISNPIFYLAWVYFDYQTYENLGVRIGISLSCLPLAFERFWPKKLRNFLPLYWYIVALYTLPFFFTFMLLKNNFSYGWSLNALTGVVLSILLLDLVSLLIILPLGIILGGLCYYFTTDAPLPVTIDYNTIIITYSSVIIFGALFARKKEKIQQDKLQTMMALSGSIAHELRTPLFSIRSGVKGIKRYFPILLEGYQKAKEANLPIKKIAPTHRDSLFKVLNVIEDEANYADTIINMLLMRVNQKQLESGDFEICSISRCVQHAIERYPFTSEKQRKLVHLNNQLEFSFNGKELLVEHILFNLIKNALYYIQAAGKGEIYIWTVSSERYNFLHFKDTGKGIPAQLLPKLFTKFFTTSKHGTGLGLAFCKMVMQGFEGDIVCHSIENEFTEFVLSFPKLGKYA